MTLTPIEIDELKRLEAIVESGLSGFMDSGCALMQIRELNLYFPHATFQIYCKVRWGIGKSHAHRLMQAAEIATNLLQDLSTTSPIGEVPDNGGSKLPDKESHIRPLAQLPKDEQAGAWNEAVKTAPGGKVTEKHVEQVVQGRAERLGIKPPKSFQFNEREPGDESEPTGEKPAGVDDHGRTPKKPRAQKPPEQRSVLKDKLGNVLPDSCRDAFADPSLADLIEELEGVEGMFSNGPWTASAAKLCDHYGFILIEKFTDHIHESLHRLQLAVEALKAGLPYALCPKCNGIDSKKDGKTCRTCRGFGHIPEHKVKEAAE